MRGILWFGVDDANTCVYIPVFNSTPEPPRELAHGNGDMLTLSWDAMFWVNNYVANQAYNRYSQMIPDIRRVQRGYEDMLERDTAAAAAALRGLPYEKARRRLAEFTNMASAAVTKGYRDLGDYLLVKFLDGNIKKETAPGHFERTATGMPVQPEIGRAHV